LVEQVMRIVALIMAILGALAALGIGGVFLLGTMEFQSDRAFITTIEDIRNPNVPEPVRTAQTQALARFFALPYFLMASGILSILGGMLAMGRRGVSAGFLFLVALAGPVALVVGVSMAHAGDPLSRTASNFGATLLGIFVGIPGFFFLLAALFAFLTRPLPAPDDNRDDDRDFPRRSPAGRSPRPMDDDD
jgi:hypothetical protein